MGLVIEIDGDSHFVGAGQENDRVRDEVLRRLNLEVLRFTNNDINLSFDAVCEKILEAVQRRALFFSDTPPDPL